MYTIAATYGYIEPDDDPYTWGARRPCRVQHRIAQFDPGPIEDREHNMEILTAPADYAPRADLLAAKPLLSPAPATVSAEL